ncbi:MAG: restriction endonuclease subunit S, partial [Gammaproteobacteria bacterium]|nr:restriction endonuclease subunit S [Gammaproteobacteria bacterium]
CKFHAGDVLYGKLRPYLNKVVLADSDGYCTPEIVPVAPSSAIENGYLFYSFKRPEFLEHVNGLTRGINMPRLTSDAARAIELPLPPINEQRRIASKLDALFERSRNIRDKLDRLPRLLDGLQKSILHAASTGELTREWRAKNAAGESATELLKRIRLERRVRWEADLIAKGKDPKKTKYVEPEPVDTADLPELPEGWCWASVGELTLCLDALRVPIKREHRKTDQGLYPYYGANGQVGIIDEFIFDEELVLVTEDETFYGRTKPIAYRVSGKCWVNNHAHVLRAINPVTPDYLWISLMHYNVIPWLSGTTGRAKLTQGALMSLPIALPPEREMASVIAKIVDSIAAVERLIPSIEKMVLRTRRVEQSVLSKAFRGELVPQDPNDEPASLLLERIKAERANAIPKQRGRVRQKPAT